MHIGLAIDPRAAFATRLALRRLAYGSTHLVALGRRALPGTLGGATVVLGLVGNRQKAIIT